MRMVKASELVQDFSFYPRQGGVDWQHVSNIALSVEAQAELPPIVTCQFSRRVVDGFHRLNALMRVHGPDVEVACVEKQYDNERAMFLDAIRYNAKHGSPLREADRKHCALMATQFAASADDVAKAFCIDPKVIGLLAVARTASTLEIAIPRREPAVERPVEARPPLSTKDTLVSVNAVNQAERQVVAKAVAWHNADETDFEKSLDELVKAIEAYLDLVKQRSAGVS